ncbi:MAG: hypothetical protein WBK97_04705 [Bacteroidales bacterium]|jgi:hypothetical protein
MKNISKITVWVLFAVSILLTILYLINLGGSKVDAWTYTYLNWAYVMVALSLILIILLPILTFKQRTVKIKPLLVTLAIAIVLVGGSYLLAPGTPVTLATGTVVEGTVVKITDTSLYMTYILVILSGVAIIGGSVYNALRKN